MLLKFEYEIIGNVNVFDQINQVSNISCSKSKQLISFNFRNINRGTRLSNLIVYVSNHTSKFTLIELQISDID